MFKNKKIATEILSAFEFPWITFEMCSLVWQYKKFSKNRPGWINCCGCETAPSWADGDTSPGSSCQSGYLTTNFSAYPEYVVLLSAFDLKRLEEHDFFFIILFNFFFLQERNSRGRCSLTFLLSTVLKYVKKISFTMWFEWNLNTTTIALLFKHFVSENRSWKTVESVHDT